MKIKNFKHVAYSGLKSRQQENYNFHKIAARLADYGFNCIPLNDDWEGADFIALHVDGETLLRVQQKGRLEVNEKYKGKDLYIAFRDGDDVYVYPHDLMWKKMKKWYGETVSWKNGGYSWPKVPKERLKLLLPYKFVAP